jgi:hypothetical protein
MRKKTLKSLSNPKKTVYYKITGNANYCKIGTKKTTVTNVKEDNKINKFVATPKRTGYIFKGEYTKKTIWKYNLLH